MSVNAIAREALFCDLTSGRNNKTKIAMAQNQWCRVCGNKNSEDARNELVAPCHCTGGQQWVHRECEWRVAAKSAAFRGKLEPDQLVCARCGFAFQLANPVPPVTHRACMYQTARALLVVIGVITAVLGAWTLASWGAWLALGKPEEFALFIWTAASWSAFAVSMVAALKSVDAGRLTAGVAVLRCLGAIPFQLFFAFQVVLGILVTISTTCVLSSDYVHRAQCEMFYAHLAKHARTTDPAPSAP